MKGFTINTDEGYWKCKQCGTMGGNIYKLLNKEELIRLAKEHKGECKSNNK